MKDLFPFSNFVRVFFGPKNRSKALIVLISTLFLALGLSGCAIAESSDRSYQGGSDQSGSGQGGKATAKIIDLYPDDGQPAHHTEEGFENLYAPPLEKSFFGFLKMRFFGDEPYSDWEAEGKLPPQVETNISSIKLPKQTQVTWIGHSTTLIQNGKVNILTDPIFSDRASPVSFAGPKRIVKPSVALEQLPKIDYVIISHNHYDHLDVHTIEYLVEAEKQKDLVWLVPLKMDEILINSGVKPSQIYTLDWWQMVELDGIKFVATPSQHWSSRSLWDRNHVLWASWFVDVHGFKIWFGGDTGYNEKLFTEMGERLAKLGGVDLGIIPIGAYKPRWFMKEQHVNPPEAVEIHKLLGAKKSFGIHWGTIQLTAESLDKPPIDLQAALKANELPLDQFEALSIGETLKFNKRIDRTLDQEFVQTPQFADGQSMDRLSNKDAPVNSSK